MHRKDRLLLYFYQTTDAPQGKGYKAKSVNIPSHQGQLLHFRLFVSQLLNTFIIKKLNYVNLQVNKLY